MDPQDKAARHIRNLAGVVRRAEVEGLGRNAGGSVGAAQANYRRALEAVVALEDAQGVDAAAQLSDRLTAARQRATAAGLLSHHDVLRIENDVLKEG